jgi:biotin carboxyl carrier protein
VEKGYVLAIAMVMKKRREIIYEGERGRVAKIYFLNGQQCREGAKLFGIVPRPFKK